MKKKITLLLTAFIVLTAFTNHSPHPITVFMIGDSTMANKKLDNNNQERGWGHMLPAFFTERVVVDNHAVNGRSSKSFIDEGRWDKVLSAIRKGDYVFIQFGHNDEKEDAERHTEPGTTFDANLKRFVNETLQKGGIPVLFNSIVRRNFDENGMLVDTHGAYLESPQNVAAELGVAFIDLNKITHELVQELGDEPSKALFMWVGSKQDDTHLNVRGARVVARLALQAIIDEVPALAPHTQWPDFVVAKDGSGDFFTVQDAINAVPDYRKGKRTTILVRTGRYKEKVIVPESKAGVSLVGEDGAVLTFDDYAQRLSVLGEELGTSGSSTCYIYGNDFSAENITFENSAGPGEVVGQAVACFVSGDRVYFRNCRFLGFQDTLYTYGKNSRQYYEDCYIEGTVDFIFGWSTAVFNRCQIHSLGNGYLTAPSTDAGKKYGYVFYDCNITATEGVDKVYLSRPWRPYGQAVFIRCHMDGHIVPEGWHNWNKPDAEKTVFYAEYRSTGKGANPGTRAAFSRQLTDIDRFDITKVLAGDDGWNPSVNGNELVEVKR